MSYQPKFPTQNLASSAAALAAGAHLCASNRCPPQASETAVRPAAEAALGNTAKSVDQIDGEKEEEKREGWKKKRATAFRLQRRAAALLPKERVGLCKWAVVSKVEGVKVHLTKYKSGAERASYEGLQTCGSVWLCPCCGQRISETRRGELNDLLAWAREQGLRPVMLTLTTRHGIRDSLPKQLEAMKKAKRRLRQRREWRAIKGRIVGTVTATEVTYGANGWHTHFHEILLIEPLPEEVRMAMSIRVKLAQMPKGEEKNEAFAAEEKRMERQAKAVLHGLDRVWRTCLLGFGLSGGRAAWHVQGAASAGRYVSKWGAGEEMTLTHAKRAEGKGRTPLELLADAESGDDEAGKLWQIYGLAFAGRRQLVWSPGLKKLAGINTKTDEEAARDETQDEAEEAAWLLEIKHREWIGTKSRKGAQYRRAEVLDAAEDGGAAAALRVVRGEDYNPDADREADLIEAELVRERKSDPAINREIDEFHAAKLAMKRREREENAGVGPPRSGIEPKIVDNRSVIPICMM